MSTSEMDLRTPPRNASPRLVTDLLTGGGVTLLVGLLLLAVARIFPLFAIPGFACTAIGVALLLAGCIIYPFMRLART